LKTQDEIMYALWKSKKYKWTQREIAELFGCDIATVCRRIEPERWKRWEIVISAEQLRDLYSKLKSIQRVADTLWCSYGVVHKRLHKYKIPVNPVGRIKHH